MDSGTEEKAWKTIQKKSRFTHAFRGLYVFWKTTLNVKVHLFIGALVVIFGCYLGISSVEWLAVVLAIGLVFITEALNTAIEIDINLTSPEYHPYARDTKDVAAGAVLLATLTAVIIGFIVFLPKILFMLE